MTFGFTATMYFEYRTTLQHEFYQGLFSEFCEAMNIRKHANFEVDVERQTVGRGAATALRLHVDARDQLDLGRPGLLGAQRAAVARASRA